MAGWAVSRTVTHKNMNTTALTEDQKSLIAQLCDGKGLTDSQIVAVERELEKAIADHAWRNSQGANLPEMNVSGKIKFIIRWVKNNAA